jgi:hypothetical protein
MPTKKVQKLNIILEAKVKDFYGVWELSVLINQKAYTYPINSEFAVEQIEHFLRLRRPGKALKVLNQFKLTGFNTFERER